MTQQRREQVSTWANVIAVVIAVVGPIGSVVYSSGRSDERADVIEARVANIEVRAREDHDILLRIDENVKRLMREERK